MQQNRPTEAESLRTLLDKLAIPLVLARETIYYVADPEMEPHTLRFRRDTEVPAFFALHPDYVATFQEMLQSYQRLVPLELWRTQKEIVYAC